MKACYELKEDTCPCVPKRHRFNKEGFCDFCGHKVIGYWMSPAEKAKWDTLLNSALDLCNGISIEMKFATEKRMIVRLDQASQALVKKKKK